MSRYDFWLGRLTGLAFLLGPLLFLAGAAVRQLALGINEGGEESAVEGVLMAYAVLCFIPIYLVLARWLGEKYPNLGIVCTVTGLFGAMGGFNAAATRIWEGILLDNGGALNPDIWEAAVVPEFMPVAIGGLFFPLTSILLGFGFLRGNKVSPLTAGMLILAGIAFLVAQAAEIALEITYPLAGLFWLIALTPLGIQFLQTKKSTT